MSSQEKESYIVPITQETKEYACGHVGPVRWNFVLFGRECEVDADKIPDPGKCGECHLQAELKRFTKCGMCGTPIAPNTSCIMYKGVLRCLGENCGPASPYVEPYLWNGENTIPAFSAGTMRIIGLRQVQSYRRLRRKPRSPFRLRNRGK